MLHSTFWIHGAGELDLPPLWAALMGEYDVVGDAGGKGKKGSSSNASNSGFMLDFLYPSGTFTFLRQFSTWPLTWQGPKQTTRLGHRLFSSGTAAINRSATGTQDLPVSNYDIPEKEDDSLLDDKQAHITIENRSEKSLEPTLTALDLIHYIESMEGPIRYEELWRRYRLVPTQQTRLVAPHVLKYLSRSHGILDLERAVSLLDVIPPEERDGETWKCGIKAFLALRQRGLALKLYRAALKHKVSSATTIVIADQLKASHWIKAYELYIEHQTAIPFYQSKIMWKRRMNDPVILELAANMPDFARIVEKLVRKLTEKKDGLTLAATPEGFQEFAITLAYHALVPSSGTLYPHFYMALLKTLRQWNEDPARLYHYLIWTLKQRNFIGLAIYTYNELRERHGTNISFRVLHVMIEIFVELHDMEGIQQVLDNWFTLYDGPDKFTYRKCLREFAWQADAATVEALFEQYTEKFCRVNSTTHFESVEEFTPLLNVYAKRGELQKVVSLFEEIQTKYQMEPSLTCWNILINAHGKVHDIDGAFERFEQLLDSPLKPDHWTIGTMMGICVSRGDCQRTLELFQLATSMEIPISTAMIDCLVLAHIRDQRMDEARAICEKATEMELICPPRAKFPRTNMWNQLLMGYAWRRDIQSVNLVLKRMLQLRIEYDKYTYSALMQCLAMLNLTSRTWKLLTQVMPQSGFQAESFHYAIVMGAYLSAGDPKWVFRTYDLMLSRNIKLDASTSLMALKANFELDRQRLDSMDSSPETIEQERLELAEEYFEQVIRSIDPRQAIGSTPQKEMRQEPIDIAYSTSVFRYMIHVFGTYRMMDKVKQYYEDYIKALPEHRRNQKLPIRMLESLMHANLQDENYKGVQQCWEIAFENAKKEATSLDGTGEFLVYRQFSLSICLTTYITAMERQQRHDELQQVLEEVEEAGFVLDCVNTNTYIQCLTRAGRVQQAFNICETKLMGNWVGWRQLRRSNPLIGRKRISIEVRALKKAKGHLRPFHYTLLCLARGWLDANEMAVEDPSGKALVEDLKSECPMLVSALKTMPRTNDPVEIQVLTGDGW